MEVICISGSILKLCKQKEMELRLQQDKAFSSFQVSSASSAGVRWSQGGNVQQTLQPLRDEVILKSPEVIQSEVT